MNSIPETYGNKTLLFDLLEYLLGRPLREYGPSPKQDTPMRKCSLPSCNRLHNHNGGYCSAEHSKEHEALCRKAGKACLECGGHGTMLHEDRDPTVCKHCKGTGKRLTKESFSHRTVPIKRDLTEGEILDIEWGCND